MFNPSPADVRRFFCEAWRKAKDGSASAPPPGTHGSPGADDALAPLERIAVRWMLAHPEYHALLDDAQAALAADYSPERGDANPFLHLSMHLAIDEQLGIDQPHGIGAIFAALTARHGDTHAAAHETMECLGRVLWESQRGVLPADPAAINDAYLECLRRRLG